MSKVETALGYADRLLGVLPDLVPGSVVDDMSIAGARGLIAIIRALLRGGRSTEEIVMLLRRWHDEGAAKLDVDATVDEWLAHKNKP